MPPYSDSILRLVLATLVALVVAVVGGLMGWVRTPAHRDQGEPIEQPIELDHRHHTRDDGIRCLYCHHEAEDGPTAGVPDTAACMGCHAQIWNDSPQTLPIRTSWALRRPIAWRRVHDLPDFVFFDHHAHVRRGVGCESCHGRVDRMAAVYQVSDLSMGWCLNCHRDPIPHLRPLDRIDTMGLAPDRVRGERIARELGIDPPTHCTGCHR